MSLQLAEDRIEAALKVIREYGGIEGDHHRAWTLTMVLASLLGSQEAADVWIREWEHGGDYEWDRGIAP